MTMNSTLDSSMLRFGRGFEKTIKRYNPIRSKGNNDVTGANGIKRHNDKKGAFEMAETEIRFEGELDLSRTGEMRDVLGDALGRRAERLIVDLNGVTFIGDAGIGLLLKTLHAQKSEGGELVLRGVSKRVQRLFEVLRLDRVFRLARQ